MFSVTEAEAATIRAAFDQDGELSAAVELRRIFPGITSNETARMCVRSLDQTRFPLTSGISATSRIGSPARFPQRGMSRVSS